jgi:hypothetical protein
MIDQQARLGESAGSAVPACGQKEISNKMVALL